MIRKTLIKKKILAFNIINLHYTRINLCQRFLNIFNNSSFLKLFPFDSSFTNKLVLKLESLCENKINILGMHSRFLGVVNKDSNDEIKNKKFNFMAPQELILGGISRSPHLQVEKNFSENQYRLGFFLGEEKIKIMFLQDSTNKKKKKIYSFLKKIFKKRFIWSNLSTFKQNINEKESESFFYKNNFLQFHRPDLMWLKRVF